MIKIKPTAGRRDDKTRVKNKRDTASVSRNEQSFSSHLTQSITDHFNGTIQELMNELSEREKRFLDSQSLHELKIYKSLVQHILKLILDEGFTVQTMKPTRRHGLEMRIVKDVNDKLIEIKQAITTSNKAFDLMKSIEEIRGLILDLLS